jgi:hypothetical protein
MRRLVKFGLHWGRGQARAAMTAANTPRNLTETPQSVPAEWAQHNPARK